MSQKQKSILSFFKQADSKKASVNTNSSVEKDLKKNDSDDAKNLSVKKDLKNPDSDDSKILSPKGNSKVVKKVQELSNGSDSKKTSINKEKEKPINKDLTDESPVKQTKKRRRAKILDSDDESQSTDELPNKKHEADQNEVMNGNLPNGCNESEDVETKKSAMSETDSEESKLNSPLPSDDMQQDEPMEEDQSVENNLETSEMVQVKGINSTTLNRGSSSVQCKNIPEPEYIPKRKTARKQMRGGQQKKKLPKKPDITSKTPETNKKNKIKINDDLKDKELNAGNSNKDNNEDDNNSDLSSKKDDNKSEESKTKDLKTKIKCSEISKDQELNAGNSDNDNNEDDNNSDLSSKKDDENKSEESKTKDVKTEIKSPEKSKDQELNAGNSDKDNNEDDNNSDLSSKKAVENKSEESKTKDVKTEIKSHEKSKDQASSIKVELSLDTEPCEEDNKSKEKSPKANIKKDANSKKKQAIHPFFAKSKKEEVSSTEGETEKITAKASSSTGVVYDPSKSHYHPIDDACWKQKEKVPYLALAKTLELIDNITKRLKIVEILANYFRSVIVLTPEDLLQSVYLCLNRLAPEYEGIELGIGELLLMKALAQATGRTTNQIKAEVAVKGDLGLVAESSRGNQRLMFAPPKLTVSSVFSKFKEIAKMSGNTAMAKKTDKIQALFVACRECEAKYIIRSLSGKLRIGLAEQSVLAALARAAVLTPPNQSYPPEIIDKPSKMSAESFKEHLNAQTLILKTTYCECPNYDLVIPVLLKEGIAGLPVHCQLTAGFPLKPMLAHPTNGIDEVLNRFDKNEFTCEFKYDGERAQIHMTDKGEIKIYSRNQEENTSKYPDVISRLSKALKETTKSFILDTEAVAWDCEAKQILPFQVLSTRKKKDAVEADIVVQVCIMAFDLIYFNGESLVKKPLKERRDLLHSAFTEVENEFMFVTYKDGNSAETMQEFLDESIKGNCEGLMVKALSVDASYEIAKRSHNWLKLKKDYLAGIGDTLDLVVIGGYHGKGKRAGTYGGFLLACYDDENEEFQSICKLGTGFSDADLENHTKFFKEHIIELPKSYYRYDTSLEPDVWFDAVQIWEIKCADLSISPIHKAAIGIVDPEKGISLRFPRFLRIRDDKSKPEDATVSSRIADMYEKQEQVQNAKKTTKTEEDYY